MSEPSRRARDFGNTVVRRTTGLVAAGCLVGTGAFVAIQAKAYRSDGAGGATPATGPQPTDPLVAGAGSSTGPVGSRACVDGHDDDNGHESDRDEHESNDDHDDHESNDDHDHRELESNADGRENCGSTFAPPAAAPATAPPETMPRVVSGGS